MTIAQLEAKVGRLTDANKWRAAQPAPKNVNAAYEQSFSRLERIAPSVTDRVGTMEFFLIIAVWTVVWLGWNTLPPAVCGSIPRRPSCSGCSSAA